MRTTIVQLANQLWHTDSSFKPVPAMASLLSGREVPPAGGETEFVSMRRTWEALPEAMRPRLDGRVVVHSILDSRSTIAPGLFDPEHERGLPPVRQALVRANPVNGRRSIYIGSHAWDNNRCVLHRGRPWDSASTPAGDAAHDRRRRGPDRRAAARHAHASLGRHHRRRRRSLACRSRPSRCARSRCARSWSR